MRVWTMATIGALALCTTTAAAQTASIGGGASVLRTTIEVGAVEKIAYRRCWWSQGVRHCRRYRSAYYYYYRGPRSYSGSTIGIIMGIQ